MRERKEPLSHASHRGRATSEEEKSRVLLLSTMLWSLVLLAFFAIIALNFAYRDAGGPVVVVSAPHFVRPSALPGSLPAVQKPTHPPLPATTQPLTAADVALEADERLRTIVAMCPVPKISPHAAKITVASHPDALVKEHGTQRRRRSFEAWT